MGIQRVWNLDSVQSHGTVGNGFHADVNGREWFAICWWCHAVRIPRLSIRMRNVKCKTADSRGTCREL